MIMWGSARILHLHHYIRIGMLVFDGAYPSVHAYASALLLADFKRACMRPHQELCSLKHRRSAVPFGRQRNAGASAGLPDLAVRQL